MTVVFLLLILQKDLPWQHNQKKKKKKQVKDYNYDKDHQVHQDARGRQ